MKTRIKVTTRTDNGVETAHYEAQFKELFFWQSAYGNIRPFSWRIERETGAEMGELAFEQRVIDILLEERASALRAIAVEDSKKVTYIKCP